MSFYDRKIRGRTLLVTIKAGDDGCYDCAHHNEKLGVCDIWGTLGYRGVARRRPECMDAEKAAEETTDDPQ